MKIQEKRDRVYWYMIQKNWGWNPDVTDAQIEVAYKSIFETKQNLWGEK